MARWRLLHHPVLLGAAFVLAVNDHALKGPGPAAITGKLSDFAGVLLVTLLTCVVVRRPLVAAASVGLAFAVLKVVPGAGAVAAPVLGGTTLQDPTDLVALAVLWPAVAIASSVPMSPAPPWGRRVLGGAALVACTMTITATSCEDYERDRVLVRGDLIFYVRGDLDSPSAVSADGGRTWAQPETALKPRPSDAQEEVCSDNGHCFRVAQGGFVEERPPGETWSRTFEFTDTERRNAELHRDGLDVPNPLEAFAFGCGYTEDLFTDAFSDVSVVEVDGVDHAVVAMGQQGVLHKEVGGDWERLAIGAYRPAPLHEPAWLTRVKIGLALSAFTSLGLFAAWWRRRTRLWPGCGLVLALAATVLTYPIFLARDPLAEVLFPIAVALVVACVYALVRTPRSDTREADREAQRARVRKWVE